MPDTSVCVCVSLCYSRKMKNPAPPPPGPPQATPRRLPRNIVPDGGVATGVDIKENVLRPRVELRLSLPSGVDTTSTFDGRWVIAHDDQPNS